MRKATSSLNNLNLEVDVQPRASLFYQRWRYCIRGFQPEFFCLRAMDHGRIDRVVSARRDWGRRMSSRQPGSWYWEAMEITEQDVMNLHRMCDFLQADTRERKVVISGSWFYIYTNDVTLISDISHLPWLDQDKMRVTEVHLQGQPGAVTLRRARHQLRSYFRSILFDDQRRHNLTRLLAQQEHIRLSPSLQYWVEQSRWHRTYDYHFIDHDDASIITLLALIEPRLIRRTLPIVEHK